MKTTARWLAALVSVGLSASLAHAQHYQYPPPWPPQPRLPVPDACGPGYYIYCPDGSFIGPNYYLRPPFEPFNGMRPQQQQAGGGKPMPGPPMTGLMPGQYMPGGIPPRMGPALPMPPGAPGAPGGPGMPGMSGAPGQRPMVAFPTHPYARGPRDFFMWGEAQEDLHTRERRPAFLP